MTTKQKKCTAPTVMQERYERASNVLQEIGKSKSVKNATIYPAWIGESNQFWYVREYKNGREYRLVNAKDASNIQAFDHQAVAHALSQKTGKECDADNLKLKEMTISLSPFILKFSLFDRKWMFQNNGLVEIAEESDRNVSSMSHEELTAVLSDGRTTGRCVSPNGKLAVSQSKDNLRLHNLETDKVSALTEEGDEFYSYGSCEKAWGQPNGFDLQVSWSPDSKRIFTVQLDRRNVKSTTIVNHVPTDGSLRPSVKTVKTAFPGDEHVETQRLIIIDVETGKIQPVLSAQVPTIRNAFGFFDAKRGWWGNDSRFVYFIDVDRFYKTARLMKCDSLTGKTQELFAEDSGTYIRLCQNSDTNPAYMILAESDELLWYSERSGWAHLYLYDFTTGELKNTVTSGEWLVREIVEFDAKRREVFIQTAGRIDGRNPYYRDLVRVNIDTGVMTDIACSDHDHFVMAPEDMTTYMVRMLFGASERAIGVSPTGDYAVVTRSRVDQPPHNILLDRDGNHILDIEIADVSALPKRWVWPQSVQLLADDGKTDIYAVVYRPSFFDEKETYPVVNLPFNTPELTVMPTGAFTNNTLAGIAYYRAISLAELGFIVVQINGRGTPFRSKKFGDTSYGWMESSNALEDQVAAIKQLGERYAYMDMDRVGVSTHLSGGSGAIQGLLHYPEFFKVAVAHCIHDSRLVGSTMWGDMYEGPDGPDTEHSFPEELVSNMKGKLLITHGMLDECIPVAAAFRIIDRLSKENKDFDSILLPNLGHEGSDYLTRRSWDYLVEHLLGEKPPKEFEIITSFD